MTMLNKKHTFIKTTFEEQWKVNKNNLSVIAPSTANPMLVLNTPNNPTGLSYSEDELSEIATVLKDRKAIVICDEIYEHLQYDNNFKSLATKLPSQSIISSGFSKSCGIGGWRIGYLVFPPELSNVRKAVVSLASETFSCVASPMQYAACEIFDPVHAPELKAYLAKSRKILHAVGTFCTRLLNDAHIRTIAPDGGFYIYPDFVTFIDKFNRNGINNSGEMTDAILEQTGVALLPSQEFGTDEGYRARLCFIDFDGTVAMSNCPEHTELTEDWLRHYCPNVIEGVEVLCKWCLALK